MLLGVLLQYFASCTTTVLKANPFLGLSQLLLVVEAPK